jgi:hypothetical protein
MSRRASEYPDDVTVYLVLNDYRTGLAYVETTAEEADRETIIRNFLSGQYSNALRVVAFNTAEGWSQTFQRTSLARCWSGPSTATTPSQKPRSGSSTGM